MKRYLIATLILAAASTPALAAAGQHYVVEDTEKFCSIIDAAPSKNLKVLGDRHGYGSRDQAEQAIKGLKCNQLPGLAAGSSITSPSERWCSTAWAWTSVWQA